MADTIERIDKNFAVSAPLVQRFPTVKLYKPEECGAEICGLFHKGEDGLFCRLPLSLLPKLSEGMQSLAYHTAGARLRFRTDSPFVAVKVKLRSAFYMRHMPLSGSAGCDIYVGRGAQSRHIRMCCPVAADKVEYEDGAFVLPPPGIPERVVRDITVTLPLYNGISEIMIGVDRNSAILPPTPYANGRVVFYGSSITQGGCASRSGNSYDQMISRRLDCDIYNLGFSGNARGETEIADFIVGLKQTAFVMDYDHNAPTVAHLADTHEPFFKTVRAALPTLPVIFMSRPNIEVGEGVEDGKLRRAVIRQTYENAVAAGDKNVYFIDGNAVCPPDMREFCFVDGAHPNDLGFMFMAKAVMPYLSDIFRNR